MLRLPDNTNLHLYHYDTFEGLPVMIDKGPFVWEYLSRLKHTIELVLAQCPRVLAFRVDLRLPLGIDLTEPTYTNQVISKFIASFKAKIEYHQDRGRERNRFAHDGKVRFIWCREVGQGGRPHYHLLILLNRDAYFKMGRLCAVRLRRTEHRNHSGQSCFSAGTHVHGFGGEPDSIDANHCVSPRTKRAHPSGSEVGHFTVID